MDFGLRDGEDDTAHNGVGFVGIYIIFETQNTFFPSEQDQSLPQPPESQHEAALD